MPRASLSSHALARARQRLKLSLKEIYKIIDDELVVVLGREKKSGLVHLLFYSSADEHHFVVIQDRSSGEVVTIMPYEFHRRWRISRKALCWAKRAIESAQAQEVAKLAAIIRSEPVMLVLFCEMFRPDGSFVSATVRVRGQDIISRLINFSVGHSRRKKLFWRVMRLNVTGIAQLKLERVFWKTVNLRTGEVSAKREYPFGKRSAL